MGRRFRLLWLSAGVAMVAHGLAGYGFLMLTTPSFGGRLSPMLLASLSALPGLAVGIVAGVWLDRWSGDRVRLLQGISAAALTGLAFLVYLGPSAGPAATYGVVVLLGVCNLLTGVVQQVVLPPICDEDQDLVRRGNAALVSQRAAVQTGTPMVGAALLAVVSMQQLFTIGATAFLAVALLIGALGTVRPEPAVGAPGRQGPLVRELLRDTAEGFGHIWRNAVMRLVLIQFSATNALMYTVIFLLPVAFTEVRVSPLWLGPVYGAIALGRAAGAALAGRVATPQGQARLIVADGLLRGALIAGVVLGGEPIAYLVGLFVAGLTQGGSQVATVTMLHRQCPPELRGRVFGQFSTLQVALLPVAPLVTIPLQETAGVGAAAIAIGAVMIAGGLLLSASSSFRRAARAGPAETHA